MHLGNPKGKGPHQILRGRWENNSKMALRGIECGDMN
jgi:hypothetical protein